MKIVRGNIIYVDLGQHSKKSSRQSGVRPCLVVSNPRSNLLSVCPFTTQFEDKKSNPVHVKVTAKDVKGYEIKPSMILVEQTVPVDRRLVVSKIGYISNPQVMENVNHALLVQYDLLKEEDTHEATK